MSQLQRRLTLFGLTMVAIGSCIGAGIFVTPSQVVAELPHAGWVLIVWAVGGLIALTGALTFAELGGMFPKAGGVYVYLKEAYGDAVGFLYGWVILLVVTTGSLAALSLIFAEYMTFFFPMAEWQKVFLAIVTIGGLTWINIRGVQTSQQVVSLFTTLKLIAILIIIALALGFSNPETTQTTSWNLSAATPDDLGNALLLALIGVLWAFGGWHHATYLAGETQKPQRNVPMALIIGTVVVTITYLLVNMAYLLLLPLDEMAASGRVAGDALEAIWSGGGKTVALIIGISIFGTIAIYTMSAPRIYFAMARDGMFFQQMAKLHPKFQTPANAMVIQSLWAILLLLFWGTFEDLITYVTFIDIAFMALAATSVFIFRRRMPEADRPYKTFGYPVIPIIFIAISTVFVINTLWEKPEQAIAGILVIGAGIVAFKIFTRDRVDPN